MRRISVRLLAAISGIGILLPAVAQAREVTLSERIAAQRAIEQVLWEHRIWPAGNPGPKPPLSAVMSDDAIRARVDDTLRESTALAEVWNRPVTQAELQAEMDRMAAGSRDPRMLRELFAALGNDPDLVAETLVRQTLVDRLVRNLYGRDSSFHAAPRRLAEAAANACASADCLRTLGGAYREAAWRLEKNGAPLDEALPLDPDEYRQTLEQLADSVGGTPESLPVGIPGPLRETEEAFVLTAVLSQSDSAVRIATVSWPKLSFDTWWSSERARVAPAVPSGSEAMTLPSLTDSTCTNDTWTATRFDMPDPRQTHTAVWTGAEMIVWGGYNGGYLNTGGRYNPATDSWVLTSTGANVPSPRWFHSAVWTGTEMIVWGGQSGAYENTGGRYNPTTDTWTPTSTGTNVPAARGQHTAIWTGTQMIVWGGTIGTLTNTGGRYTPSSDSWLTTSTGTGCPTARTGHTAVWSGTQMIVWGGSDSTGVVSTGSRYTPSTNAWAATSTGANCPSVRSQHTAVWSGTVMVVWGGGNPAVNTGGRYNPSTNAWTATSTGANCPSARSQHTAVWTGTEMIVWGGGSSTLTNTGGRYNPSTDAWTATSTGANVPSARESHTAVWTGTEMIVWGGGVNTGGRYNPASNSWVPTSTGTVPPARLSHTAVWTGAEMIVWGGTPLGGMGTGGRYTPATDSWTATSTGSGVPSSRYTHTAVWTGTRMIVWGGYDGNPMNTGGLYDPAGNAWTPTSTGANCPVARQRHTAVWTGTEMIVWGGLGAANAYQNTGGRYAPGTDSWGATSTGSDVPAGRYSHTAVWTGTQMVVWGGLTGTGGVNDGGRYTPATDSWAPTSTGTGVATARYVQTAVWTGSEMIVWGGEDAQFGSPLRTGSRYDPVADAWTAMANLPSGIDARYEHSAVWSGVEMIVWGGEWTTPLDTGARYDPATNGWTATSTGANTPPARNQHTAVWTGSEMIVWGGYPTTASGGRYCACPTPGTFYRDADGDGFGDPTKTKVTCDGSVPAGYLPVAGDCNDAASGIHPGATEVCDGADNNCDGSVDNVALPAGIPQVSVGRPAPGTARITWSYGGADSTGFDLVKGNLGTLHSSGGDFAASTSACLANDAPASPVDDAADPGPGEGFFYLLRPVNCGGHGTYDSGAPSQIGLRDAEIAASGHDCS